LLFFGGDFIKAHREGIAIAKASLWSKIPRLGDIVLVSSFPCDDDYWQASKGSFPLILQLNPAASLYLWHRVMRDWNITILN